MVYGAIWNKSVQKSRETKNPGGTALIKLLHGTLLSLMSRKRKYTAKFWHKKLNTVEFLFVGQISHNHPHYLCNTELQIMLLLRQYWSKCSKLLQRVVRGFGNEYCLPVPCSIVYCLLFSLYSECHWETALGENLSKFVDDRWLRGANKLTT